MIEPGHPKLSVVRQCELVEFIPIKSLAAKGSNEPESYATHNRFP